MLATSARPVWAGKGRTCCSCCGHSAPLCSGGSGHCRGHPGMVSRLSARQARKRAWVDSLRVRVEKSSSSDPDYLPLPEGSLQTPQAAPGPGAEEPRHRPSPPAAADDAQPAPASRSGVPFPLLQLPAPALACACGRLAPRDLRSAAGVRPRLCSRAGHAPPAPPNRAACRRARPSQRPATWSSSSAARPTGGPSLGGHGWRRPRSGTPGAFCARLPLQHAALPGGRLARACSWVCRYLQHACVACAERGEWILRQGDSLRGGGHKLGLVCQRCAASSVLSTTRAPPARRAELCARRCVRAERVQRQLQERGLRVDLIGACRGAAPVPGRRPRLCRQQATASRLAACCAGLTGHKLFKEPAKRSRGS